MRAITLLAMLLCCSLPVWANDGYITGVGGTLRPFQGEHKTIRMVREHVRMTLLPDRDYRVTVDFVFRNDGRATSVLMGFPESGAGDSSVEYFREHSRFLCFATWVDGRRVRARRVVTGKSMDDVVAHWVKRVRFVRGQTRRVRVRYTSRCGWSTIGDGSMAYEFTGGNWRGLVDESLLTLTVTEPGTFAMQPSIHYSKPAGNGSMTHNQRGNRFFYRWHDWQAEASFYLQFMTLLPGQMAVNFEKPARYYEGHDGGPEYRIDVPQRREPHIRFATARRINNYTPATIYRGMAVIGLRDLFQWLHQQDKHYGRVQPALLTWNQRHKTAWLRAGSHLFGFRPGQAHMLIDKKVYRLSAPPLFVRHNHDYFLYVPLAPIMKALGGKVKAVPERRRLWFHL